MVQNTSYFLSATMLTATTAWPPPTPLRWLRVKLLLRSELRLRPAHLRLWVKLLLWPVHLGLRPEHLRLLMELRLWAIHLRL